MAKMTGKQRAVRIPLDYYKRRDALGRWKLGLAFLAPLVALGWWFGGDAVRPGQADLRVSHGPVAAAHATWEHQCEACHEPFKAIGTETWPAKYLGDSFVTPDTKCQTCHAGPAHHDTQIEKDVPSCASCHRDHRGRDASLVRSPDGDCTSCHADLKAHVKDPNKLVYGDVDAFHQDHPEFAVLRTSDKAVRLGDTGLEDPSDLKFNHKVHMTPGMGQGYTLDRIINPDDPDRQKADRDRYRRDPKDQDTVEVQLECASCHVSDPGDLRGASEPVSSPGRGGSGAYMMPIVYENQCRACHPLDISRPGAGRKAVAEGEAEAPADAGAPPSLTVPHGKQPAEIHKYLYGAVAAEVLAGDPALQQRRRLPGPAGAEAQQAVLQAVEERVFQAEQVLFVDKQTCTECHDYEAGPSGAPVEVLQGQAPTFLVKTPDVPDVWFPHAVFNHAAHRAVDCRQCHALAYPSEKQVATTSEPVMLPGIATCRKCHAPTVVTRDQVSGGARFDCVECHRYHNGDRPRQGPGALAQDPKPKGSIAEFLMHTGPFAGSGTAAAAPTAPTE